MHSTLLAFDIGTSGLKASLVDENLNIIRNVTTSYPTHHYPNGGCEQEAADWWMSAVRAMMMLRELAPEYVKRVDAIGVSGHMLGCLPMDKDGQTLRPAMIHADTRALAISNALRARFGRDYFYEICGNVLSPASTLCKTLWLKEHEPELYARTYRILQSKDYLVYRLTGHMETTDMSDASHGLLMNLETRQYDTALSSSLFSASAMFTSRAVLALSNPACSSSFVREAASTPPTAALRNSARKPGLFCCQRA